MAISRVTPDSTNLVGDAVKESRQHLRKLLASIDQLIAEQRIEEARKHLPKLESMAQEVRRILNPRDPVERKFRLQIDRDLDRVQKALREGWGGKVGKGLLAVGIAGVAGCALVVGILYFAFFR